MRRFALERQTLTVEFGGDTESVDIDAFIHVMAGYSRTLREAGAIVAPGKVLNVSISAVRPGCVSVDLEVAVGFLGALASVVSPLVPVLPDIVETTSQFWKLKRFLGKNGQPKSVERVGDGSVSITAGSGANITVVQNSVLLAETPAANRAFNDAFAALERDGGVGSLSIKSQGDPLFSADRSEFGELSKSPELEVPQTQDSTENVRLAVVKPNFENSTTKKWGFSLHGTYITAPVRDSEFLERLGEYRFTRGTVMLATLRITRAYDKNLRIFVDCPDSYVVEKVLEVDEPNEQPELPM